MIFQHDYNMHIFIIMASLSGNDISQQQQESNHVEFFQFHKAENFIQKMLMFAAETTLDCCLL